MSKEPIIKEEIERKHYKVYTDALNKALEIFVSYTENTFDDVMSKGLRPIADAADLDRIIVYRVWEKERNYAGEVCRWDKARGGTVPVDESLKVLPVFGAMKRWISMMSNDICVSLRRSEFEEDESAFLSPRGVMSIFLVPVFIRHDLWGVVTFHDNKNERDFDEDCTAMLRSTARLCAENIIREEKKQIANSAIEKLKRHEKMLEALNNASVTLLSQGMSSFNDMMTTSVKPIADMADIDRMVLYRNNMKPDGLYMSQVYRWDRNSGGSTELTAKYMDVPYTQFIPEGEKHLKAGNSLNTIVKLLSKAEAAVFQSFGIVSVAVIPIYINGIFWGFTIFGDIRNERNFDVDIIEMMRSASFLFANALIRSEEADKERKATEKHVDILKSVLNGLDMTICVTVPETGEILFINDALKKQYGIKGDKIGQLCYKVFQDSMAERCDFCPYYKLEKEPDAVVEWEQLEPLINRTKRKTARLIDWPGYVKAHMEVAIDVTAMKQAQVEAEHHAKMIGTLNDIAILLLSQREETFEDSMTNGISAIANMLDLDRVTVWRNTMKPEGLYGAQIFRWDKSEGGTTPVNAQLKNIKVSEWAPRWEKVLSAGEIINGPARLLPEAALLQSFGCVSTFIFPIFKDNAFWGYVMFDDRRRERVFTDSEMVILSSTSLMIYNVVIRHEESVQINRMMNEIEHQSNLLHTVNRMSAILLESHTESFESNILRAMKIVAGTVQANRMYIWKNFVRDGKLYCSQIHEWSEGVASQKDYKLAGETMYSDIVPDWEERLSKGNCISGIVREMSDYEKAALSPQGILSVLIAPIFIKNQFWGFVGFDDCHNERIFSDKEEMILVSASQIIATALSRNDMEHEAAERNELVRIIVEASPVGLSMFDEKARLFDCNNTLVNMFDVSKQCFLDRFSEFSPEYQPDGRKSIEKAVEIMKYTFDKKIMMTYEWVHKKLNGELIPCEIALTYAMYNGKQIGLVYVYDLRNIRNLENNIKQLEKEVDKIYYDPLTGIYNRRYFDENLKRTIKLLSRSKGVISLMMIDIDFFKDYNDTYGHGAGDRCLKIIAETLKNTITRSGDFVARYGGEEFVIVLPNTNENGVRLLAKNMLMSIRNCNIPHSASDVAGCVTISIGVATGMVEYTSNGADLVKIADEMLYKSKRNGRDRYNFRSI